jgi:hypothetical protein
LKPSKILDQPDVNVKVFSSAYGKEEASFILKFNVEMMHRGPSNLEGSPRACRLSMSIRSMFINVGLSDSKSTEGTAFRVVRAS